MILTNNMTGMTQITILIMADVMALGTESINSKYGTNHNSLILHMA
ncbi:hypothetical protein KHP59_02675 [Virgibacillus sp. 19R1-5]|nr:hypothetical protein [Virgibacillus sp. 19R1-5]